MNDEETYEEEDIALESYSARPVPPPFPRKSMISWILASMLAILALRCAVASSMRRCRSSATVRRRDAVEGRSGPVEDEEDVNDSVDRDAALDLAPPELVSRARSRVSMSTTRWGGPVASRAAIRLSSCWTIMGGSLRSKRVALATVVFSRADILESSSRTACTRTGTIDV